METLDLKSERHLRKIDRQRRLAEIEIAYRNVVDEAKVKHETLYNTVFNESAEMDEATILVRVEKNVAIIRNATIQKDE